MAKDVIKRCKHCGAEIMSTSNICLNCGAKNEKPFYKKTWFIVMSVILLLVVIGTIFSDSDGASNNNSGSAIVEAKQEEQRQEEQPSERRYESITIGELSGALNANAARAQNQYKGKYIRITGPLGIIDSDSNFFQLDMPLDDNYNNFICYVHKDKISKKLLGLNKGQAITVLGQIIGVGEMLGYEIEVDDIEAPKVGYSDDELCEIAVAYWRKKNGNNNRKICVEITDSNANEATIHLYIDNETATETLDWYYVNRMGRGSNFMEEPVDLTE